MRRFLVPSLLVVFFSIAPPASADIITITAADVEAGLLNDFPGAVLSRLHQPEVFPFGTSAVYAPMVSEVIGLSTLTFGFENYDDCYSLGQSTARRSCGMGFTLLEVRFDTPTDFVHLESLFLSDAPRIWAYDSDDNMIGNIGVYASHLAPDSSRVGSLQILHDTADIARIVTGGAAGNARITEVSYNKVPEPTTLGLLSMGLVGLALIKRRER